MIASLIVAVVWAFLFSLFSIPSIISMSHSKNLLDIPNHRTVHLNLTPRLGGVAIFAAWISSLFLFGKVDIIIQQLVSGTIVIFFLGVKDDMESVPAVKKFFIQFLATIIIPLIGGLRISSLQGIFGIYELPISISYLITIFAIIGITNAINLIDGIDGLAGSIILLCSLVFGTYFYLSGDPFVYVCLAMVGSICGFLYFNFKSKIFMGDTGSLVAGFILAVTAIKFVEAHSVRSSPAIAISILIIPLFDTLRVFTLRILKGQSPFHPDKNHIHHRLLALGLKPFAVVLTLVLFNLLIIAVISYFRNLGTLNLLVVIISFCFSGNHIISFFKKRDKLNESTIKPNDNTLFDEKEQSTQS